MVDIVDMHMHLYPSREVGEKEKAYEVWEYGDFSGVQYSDSSGTVEDGLEAMAAAEVSKAVLLIYFKAQLMREEEADAEGAGAPSPAKDTVDDRLLDQLASANQWGCEVSRRYPQIATYVTVDLAIQSQEEATKHFREMVEVHGARGLKLHCALQRFSMSDERLWPIYAYCQERKLPVLGHGGPDRQGAGLAEPKSFERMLKEFPDLTVVIAHMGGAAWRQASEIADTCPNAHFDCCEIIHWTGAPKAPSGEELARLIRSVGSDRVMMGSDFPWYDLDHTVARVMELPLLSKAEKEAILGENAIRILGL